MALVPALIMLLTTIGAFVWQLIQALTSRDAGTNAWKPDWIIALIAFVLIVVALTTTREAVGRFYSLKKTS